MFAVGMRVRMDQGERGEESRRESDDEIKGNQSDLLEITEGLQPPA